MKSEDWLWVGVAICVSVFILAEVYFTKKIEHECVMEVFKQNRSIEEIQQICR